MITFQLIIGSVQNGTVTSFNTTTGAFVFNPNPGFVGIGSFIYEAFCDTGNGPISLGTATATITVTCPGPVPSGCLSLTPSILVNGRCLSVGDRIINYVVGGAGIIRLYDRNRQLITTTATTQAGNYQINIVPANVWDAYYITFEQTGLSESQISNIVTVCPAEPVQECCCPTPCHGHCNGHY